MKNEATHEVVEAELARKAALPESVHLAAAQAIVRHNCLIAAGLGLIPVPLADWAAITTMQSLMLRQLCAEYGVTYDKARASRYVGALLGGWASTNLGYGLASLLKMVPIIGLTSYAAVPAMAYAGTYAVGEIFIPHFESGGNLYTFDPSAHTALFAYYYNKGKDAAAKMSGKSLATA